MWREVNSLLHTYTITDVTTKYKRLKVSAVLININISPPEYFYFPPDFLMHWKNLRERRRKESSWKSWSQNANWLTDGYTRSRFSTCYEMYSSIVQ